MINLKSPRGKQLINRILHHAKVDYSAIMLFGSVARGDNSKLSDVDVLCLIEEYVPSYKFGNINYSTYTSDSLEKIAFEGSLFVLHLICEGVVIEDKHGKLKDCLKYYRKPTDYSAIFSDLMAASDLLMVTKSIYDLNWFQYNQAAVHLLRSTLYAKTAFSYRPTFSIGEISKYFDDQEILKAVDIKLDMEPNYDRFLLCRDLLCQYLERTKDHKILGKNLSLQSPESAKIFKSVYNRINGVSESAHYL